MKILNVNTLRCQSKVRVHCLQILMNIKQIKKLLVRRWMIRVAVISRRYRLPLMDVLLRLRLI